MWYLLAAVLCLAGGIAAQDEPCVCLERFGTEELRNPTFFKTAPGDEERIFVGEQPGLIWIYDRAGNRNAEPFLDVSDRFELSAYDERGLLGMAFHPNFQNNRKFYVYFSQTLDITRLAEFVTAEDDPDMADMSSERVILDREQPFSNHNGGEIFFATDDMLYVFYGDGGGSGGSDLAQDMTTHLGKVLRIDIDTGDDDIPYLVPEDNPFLDLEGAEPEIYATGLRNPWRCTMDEGDSDSGEGRGRIFCADVGENYCEEVDIVIAGGNYGWDVKECIFCHPPGPDPDPCIDDPVVTPGEEVLPIYWYTEWGPGGQSITGGHVYRGSSMPAFNGDYFWTDWRVRDHSGVCRLREEEDGTWSNAEVVVCDASACTDGLESEHEMFAFAFGQDQDLEMYVLESSSVQPNTPGGVIYKLVDPESKKSDQ